MSEEPDARYVYLMQNYEPDFKDRIELEISVVDRLWSAGLEEAAAPYRDSATFKADWSDSSRGFMSVSALQERLDAYALSLCAQLPDVAALNERVAARRTAVELLLLLEESGFDLDLAAAAAEAGGRSAAQNCGASFDKDPMIQEMIAQAEQQIAEDRYPDCHRILAPGEDGAGRGGLFLSNERFVGHVALFETSSEDPIATAAKNLESVGCHWVVSCVDRPKLLEEQGFKYCVVPIGDSPTAVEELREILDWTYSFIDNARAAGGGVVVHCNMGMSRSAAVLMGYLIRRQRWTYERAYMHTKLIRGVVSPNEGFEAVLQEYERQYAEDAAVEGGGGVASPEVARGEIDGGALPPALLQQPATLGAGDLSDVSLSTSAAPEAERGGKMVRTYTPKQQVRLEIDAMGDGPDFTREEILEIEPPQGGMVQRQASGSQVTVPLATPIIPGRPQRVDLGSSPILPMTTLTHDPSDGGGLTAAGNSSLVSVALTPGSMAAGGMDGSMQQRDADISVGTVLGDLLHDSLDEATESAEKATAAPLVHEGGRWRCCSSQLPPVVPQTPSVELELELEASPPKGGGDGWRRCCPPPKAPLMEENPVEDSMILQDRRIESAGGLQQLGSGPGLRELSPRAQSSSGSEHSPRAGELPPANENEEESGADVSVTGVGGAIPLHRRTFSAGSGFTSV